jgi:hypothetical protein
MMTIDESSIAMNTPSVVFDRAVHLYLSGAAVVVGIVSKVNVDVSFLFPGHTLFKFEMQKGTRRSGSLFQEVWGGGVAALSC